MNPLFFLTILVVGFAGYKLGQFITFRDLSRERNTNIRQSIQDNASGTPVGNQVAREMGIQL